MMNRRWQFPWPSVQDADKEHVSVTKLKDLEINHIRETRKPDDQDYEDFLPRFVSEADTAGGFDGK